MIMLSKRRTAANNQAFVACATRTMKPGIERKSEVVLKVLFFDNVENRKVL